ncbi:hypothetical protein JTB14_008398 [Gonioctena quinquepunctata]|nr:hypothetical protein JTB14_008398 [Gonioctena quinquepunctata]
MQIFIVYAAAIFAVTQARPGGGYEHFNLAGYGAGGDDHLGGDDHYSGGLEASSGGYEAAEGGYEAAGAGFEHEGLGGNEIGHGHEGQHEEYVDYHAPAKYHYDYAVHDLHTHDIKSQWETRNGDKVKGEYTVVEPDGSKRIVSYTSDKHTGFNAIVKKVHDY